MLLLEIHKSCSFTYAVELVLLSSLLEGSPPPEQFSKASTFYNRNTEECFDVDNTYLFFLQFMFLPSGYVLIQTVDIL